MYITGTSPLDDRNLQVNAWFVPSDIRGLQLLDQDDDYSNEEDEIDLRRNKNATTWIWKAHSIKHEKKLNRHIRIRCTMIEATTGPLITHQRAVFSFVSQHLTEEEEEEEEDSAFQ